VAGRIVDVATFLDDLYTFSEYIDTCTRSLLTSDSVEPA
jgi:hypothetical protein